MANEFRSSENAKSGSLTPGNSLTNAGTSMVSSALAQVQAVDATKHVRIVLDPLGTGNGPEVAYITAHTAASTGATIVRGREGTSGVAHTSTTAWVHGPGISDHIWRGTSAERNALTGGVPFVGQFAWNYSSTTFEVYHSATTGWTAPWNISWGRLTHSQDNGSAAIHLGPSGETVAVTSTSVTVPANRVIKITAGLRIVGTVAFYTTLRIRRGTTVGGTLVNLVNHGLANPGSGVSESLDVTAIDTGASGATQYVLTTDSGDQYSPSYIIVEDLGPSAAPA